jgi:hypothetical protein
LNNSSKNNDKLNNLNNKNIESSSANTHSQGISKENNLNMKYFQIQNDNLTIDQQSEIISRNVIINRSFNHPFLPISYILTRSSNVIALPYHLQFSTKFKVCVPTLSLNQINNIHAPYLIYINLVNYKYLYPNLNIKPIVNNNPGSIIKKSVDQFLSQLIQFKVIDPSIFDIYHKINNKTYRNGKNYKKALKFNSVNSRMIQEFLINNKTNNEYLNKINENCKTVNFTKIIIQNNMAEKSSMLHSNNKNRKNVEQEHEVGDENASNDDSGDEDFLLNSEQ